MKLISDPCNAEQGKLYKSFTQKSRHSDCMSRKIKILLDEGYPRDQAIAIAYSYCGKKRGPARKSIDYQDVHTPRLGRGGGSHMTDDEIVDEELEKETPDPGDLQALLHDEEGGIDALSQAIESAEDPKLKAILQAILEDEQKHQAALEQYIQESGGPVQEEPPEESAGEPGEEPDNEVPDVGLDEDENDSVDMSEMPDEDEDKEDEPDKDESGSKDDLIEDIRAVLEQHESADDTEKSDETADDKDDDLPDFLKEDDETEESDNRTQKSYRVPFFAKAADQQIVYGVVSEPDTIDLQGDRLSASEIRKACHRFMMESQRIGKEHEKPVKADVIESYIAPVDFVCKGQRVRKGSWVMAVKIHDPDVWESVKRGDITGFSIAGSGKRTPF